MAEERGSDRTSETGTRGSGRSRKAAKVADRDLDTSLDLSSSADTATAEGFVNHPHADTTELNASSDTETPRSISSAISSAQDAISGLSREDIINNFKSYASKASDTLREQASGLRERYKDIPANGRDMSRQIFERVDTSARANPWLSIGLAGVGALALGFIVGRAFTGPRESEITTGYDFDQTTDE